MSKVGPNWVVFDKFCFLIFTECRSLIKDKQNNTNNNAVLGYFFQLLRTHVGQMRRAHLLGRLRVGVALLLGRVIVLVSGGRHRVGLRALLDES